MCAHFIIQLYAGDAVEVGGELLGFMFAQQRAIALLQQSVAFLRVKLELYQRAYGAWREFVLRLCTGHRTVCLELACFLSCLHRLACHLSLL